MELQTLNGLWLLVETRNGQEVIPYDAVPLEIGLAETLTPDPRNIRAWEQVELALSPFLQSSEVESVELVKGWGCRYSASNYLDCSDWVLGEDEKEAIEVCKQVFGDQELIVLEEEL